MKTEALSDSSQSGKMSWSRLLRWRCAARRTLPRETCNLVSFSRTLALKTVASVIGQLQECAELGFYSKCTEKVCTRTGGGKLSFEQTKNPSSFSTGCKPGVGGGSCWRWLICISATKVDPQDRGATNLPALETR